MALRTYATSESGEPRIGNGHTLWYRWTAKLTGNAQLLAFADPYGSFGTAVAVYTGTSLSDLVSAMEAEVNLPPSAAASQTN